MSRIGLIDVDGGKTFPNIALMKISAYHKSIGDTVEWYGPFDGWFDKVYMSKVFSFTPDYDYHINADEVVKGGTGYAISLVNGKELFDKSKDENLPVEVEAMYPDYSLYPTLTQDTAFGFLTRGCPRGCDFCIVGKKEGRCSVKVADLSQFWGAAEYSLMRPKHLGLQGLERTVAAADRQQGKGGFQPRPRHKADDRGKDCNAESDQD